MQQLATLWNALDLRKRLIVGTSVAAVFVLVLLIARLANAPSMALLYAGLEPSVSGEVVTALEQSGTQFTVNGNAIYVEASQRDFLRVTLAEQGLPANGTAGYELLDNLNGFGVTAQMFDATVLRAKEGELARTILAWPNIRSARVHIANQAQQPFGKPQKPVASVTVKVSGGGLTTEHVQALRFLIASAVSGMAAEDVSVIDADRGLIQPENDAGNGAAQGPYADRIRANIERLLAARVGAGNVVVEVSVDTSADHETIVERRFDPNGRVAISTDTQEVSGSASDKGNSAVTVASNLPEGDAAGGDSSSKSSSTETRERVNYEVSETTRELVKSPGQVNRITVAAMVNGLATPQANGEIVWAPRPEAELAALQELVQSAIGFNAERGDVVTIKSMEFQPLAEAGTLALPGPFDFVWANSLMLVQLSVMALVALGLGMFVVRPILTAPPLALPEPMALPNGGEGQPAQLALLGAANEAPPPPDPVEQLRQLIAERQDETAEVLRNWIETSEEELS